MDKKFLTFNQQMKKLRDVKSIDCNGSDDKTLLIRKGYFNLVNGYKKPFIEKKIDDAHIYFKSISISEIYELQKSDEDLRYLLLRKLTEVEEELRSVFGYIFEKVNSKKTYSWFNYKSYRKDALNKHVISLISSIYYDLKNSRQKYMAHYMDNHDIIPTWVMIKAVKLSTFINMIEVSKDEIIVAFCDLYNIENSLSVDKRRKKLISMLNWIRQFRNACAHNERVYSFNKEKSKIKTEFYVKYFTTYGYRKDLNLNLFDLVIILKYFVPHKEYMAFVNDFKAIISNLEVNINKQSFQRVRSRIGVRRVDDIDFLLIDRNEIEYNKLDSKIL